MDKISNKDCILIAGLRLEKLWGARKIIQFYSGEGLSLTCVSRLIIILDTTGSPERVKGSGGSRTMRIYIC